MSRAHLVDRMYKERQLFPHVSEKVVYTNFKKGKLYRNKIGNKFQKEAA